MTENEQDAFPPHLSDDDELMPFDVRDTSGRSGILKLFLGLGLLLVLALVALKIYQPGVRDRNSPPKIEAENTPFKIEPKDVGGTATPDQDKAVYDVMNGKDLIEEVKPQAEPEVPVTLPKKANIIVADPPTVTTDPVVTPKAADVKPVVPAKPTPGVTSEFVVQVASVRSERAAQDIWTKLESDFSDVLATAYYADIRRADLDDRGIYYRLRVSGLANKAAADSLCAKFKSRNQSCFVTRR